MASVEERRGALGVDERRTALFGERDALRANRMAGRTPDNPDPSHYYDDYGFRMNESTYEMVKGKDEEFSNAVGNVQSEIEKGKGLLQGTYEAEQQRIKGLGKDIPDWDTFKTQNLKKVQLFGEGLYGETRHPDEFNPYTKEYADAQNMYTENPDPRAYDNVDEAKAQEWREQNKDKYDAYEEAQKKKTINFQNTMYYDRGSYYLPQAAIDKIFEEYNTEEIRDANLHVFRQDDGSLMISFINEASPIYKDFVPELEKAESEIKTTYQQQLDQFKKEQGGALAALDVDYETGTAQIGAKESELEAEIAAHNEYKSMLKKRYEERLKRGRKTLSALGGNK